MYKLYNLERNEIDEDEFIHIYNECYYVDSGQKIPRVVKSSRYVEERIDDILKRGIQNQLDVVYILAWKIGKIKHTASEQEQDFVFASDWEHAKNFDVLRYKRPFRLKEIADYVASNIKELESKAESNPQGVLNQLNAYFVQQNISGLGTVYLLTLLYFISKGKYPIYDRFASIAIDAIIAEKNPGSKISYHLLPAKDTERFKHVFEENMVPYMKKIKKVFGDTNIYKNNPADRNIDRALWVYGHLFSDMKKKRK